MTRNVNTSNLVQSVAINIFNFRSIFLGDIFIAVTGNNMPSLTPLIVRVY